MKRNAIVAVGIAAAWVLLCCAGGNVWGQQTSTSQPASALSTSSPAVMLEKGIYTEETVGDLDAAIKVYQQIVDDSKAGRQYAAQAQYRLAMCYLKKGDKAKASAELQELLKSYPQEKDVTAKAQGELDKLIPLDELIAKLRKKGTTDKDVIRVLGEPEKYIWGNKTFTKDNLPEVYILQYPNGVQVVVVRGVVSEFRSEQPGPGFVYRDKLRLGSPLANVLNVLGQPSQTVVGEPIGFVTGVLYKDFDGHKGYSYYSCADQGVRIFLVNDKINALYLTAEGDNQEFRPAASPGFEKRKINKKVADFPSGADLSSPESACAAWQRACAAKDSKTISEMSLVRIDPDQDRQWWANQEKKDPEGLAVYVKAIAESEVVEVLVYKDDLAAVITFLPFPEGKGRNPYSLRSFGQVSGQWKNLGEDRLPSLEEAEATFGRKKDNLWANFQSVRAQREGKAGATPAGDVAPHVVETTPAAFANDVDPSLDKITVTFDKPMMDDRWSWTGGGETFPKSAGSISYDDAKTTCTNPVKLEAGKVYWVGINSPSHKNFTSADGKPAKWYVIVFATKSADGKSTPIPDDLLNQAKRINAAAAQPSTQDQEAQKAKLVNWVEKFFSENFRDITARKTLEWGEPEVSAGGNLSIRYKYLATIWNKDQVVIDQRFTFTAEGKYVSAETIEKSPASKPATQPTATDKREAENLNSEGWVLWKQRKLAEAQAKFQSAVEKDPTNSNAWNGLGWSQFNQGKPLNAKDAFEKAVAIDPKAAASLNGLGWIAKGQDKTDEAIEYWSKAVAAAPMGTAALSGLATTYMEIGQYDKAAQAYQQWLKAEPENKDAKDGLKKAQDAAEAAKAAQAAAEKWLKVIGAGKYEQSWDEMGKIAQLAVTKAQWVKDAALLAPMGELKFRKLLSAVYATTLPGVPDGQYVTMQYESSFANKAKAVETVTLAKEADGTWKVAGYFVK
jgi:tetratricopeptide (TPR) repeat protein